MQKIGATAPVASRASRPKKKRLPKIGNLFFTSGKTARLSIGHARQRIMESGCLALRGHFAARDHQGENDKSTHQCLVTHGGMPSAV
jgi:hypothetical protein